MADVRKTSARTIKRPRSASEPHRGAIIVARKGV